MFVSSLELECLLNFAFLRYSFFVSPRLSGDGLQHQGHRESTGSLQSYRITAHIKSAVHADGVCVRLPAVELCNYDAGIGNYFVCLPSGSTANTDPQFFCTTDPTKGGRCCPISDNKSRAQAEAGTGRMPSTVGIKSNPFDQGSNGGGNLGGFCNTGSDLECPLGFFCSADICVKSAC